MALLITLLCAKKFAALDIVQTAVLILRTDIDEPDVLPRTQGNIVKVSRRLKRSDIERLG
ncbi:hypothetical protein AB4520_12695 [Vibrio renipiscarius]|uniref:hypothetical protein n=1 Tax=Vibrio renipiscarius TaxID=1461322 RepID=UPI003550E4FC